MVVFFALLLPVLMAIGAVVISIGNWYVHKRHLQTQVDAAAFAGATKFVGCSFQFGDPVAANAAIRAEALRYAGDTNRVPTPADTYNAQLSEPADVHVVLNSADYWAQGDDLLGAGLDETRDFDGDPSTPSDPCSSKTLDVKATDDRVPALWRWLPLSPSPKSKARVEIRQIREQMRMLPFAVPEVDPAAVVALFVDEDDGTVFASQALQENDVPDLPFSEWSTYELEAITQEVYVGSDNVGVVILVSKENPAPQRTGSLAEICGQAPNLVACYSGSTPTSGLSFIHGFSGIAGAPPTPQIRDVNLVDVTCGADDDSAPYFLLTGDCEVAVRAIVDFGVAGDPTLDPSAGGIGAQLVLQAPGCRTGCAMEYVGQSVDDESIWETTGTATLPAADSRDNGRQDFSIEWSTLVDNPATPELDPVLHEGTFSGVAHPYVADDVSGPVLYLQLYATKQDPATGDWLPVPDANSVNKGNAYRYVVEVGLVKPLQLRDPLEDPILLRYASPSGSLNQALDCDIGLTLTTEIANGCQTLYGLNYYDWDKDDATPRTWADITCSRYGVNDLPPPTFSPPPGESAPICVAAKTGDVIAFVKGLKERFETPSCTPNNWPETEEEIAEFFGEDGYDLANDPRYVSLVITDITAFEGSGSKNIPVKYFAGFYATGWDISPHTTGCPGQNDPHPIFGEKYKRSKDNGDVWGHFINIIEFSSAGKADDQLCNFDELGNCIAVLVE